MSDKSIKGRSPILIKTHKRKIHNLPASEMTVTDKFAAKVHEDARTGKKQFITTLIIEKVKTNGNINSISKRSNHSQ